MKDYDKTPEKVIKSNSVAGEQIIINKEVVDSDRRYPRSKEPLLSHLEHTYRKNEIIVTFKHYPTEEEMKIVEEHVKKKIGVKNIKHVSCGGCDLPIQLWMAKGINTMVSNVKGGTGPGTKTVGENYSLNFLSKIPLHVWDHSGPLPPAKRETREYKELVTIAVLDTGLDPYIVDPGYTHSPLENVPGAACYKDHLTEGWNFVADNGDIEDDSPGRHGSLVTQFIINEFKKNPDKTLRIIPAKTHDHNGEGDLFKIFCAIYYAIAKGANIINASWGFYYYYDYSKVPKQLEIAMKKLKEQGVLFVTAAGNKVDADDAFAIKVYHLMHGVDPTPDQLRDLSIHHFMPACLSRRESNLISVTTTNGDVVAPTENHSNIFVDLGVKADSKDQDEDLCFNVPFELASGTATVKGSSFATAIASGIIGANCKKSLYKKKVITKKDFIEELFSIATAPAKADLCKTYPPLRPHLVRKGVGVK